MIEPQALGALSGAHELLLQLIEDLPARDCNRRFDPRLPSAGWLLGRAVFNPRSGLIAAAGVAEMEETAAEVIAEHKSAFDNSAIPAVVFTDPEIAWAGLTETDLLAAALGRPS